MKKGFYGIGSLIILLIAAFVFVILPAMVGGSSSNSKLPAFGEYDGKQIRYEQGTDFAQTVSNYAQMYKNQGKELDNSSYLTIFSYAFNSTVTRMAYSQAVEESGWKVPSKAVDRAMIPYFSDENGKYSSRLYKTAEKSKIVELKEALEKQLLYSRYSDDCFGSSDDTVGKDKLFGLKTPATEITFLKKMGEEKRNFSLAAFNMTDYPDSEKAAYGKAHADDFIKYNMSVITTTEEAEAKKVLNRLENSEITFDDAVTSYSQKTYSDAQGKLTSFYAYQLKNIINDEKDYKTLTALDKDATSVVIKTETGYSIFHVDDKPVQPDFTKNDTLVIVYNYLKNNKQGQIEDYYTSIAKNFKTDAAAEGFDEACKKFDVKKKDVPAFPLNYGNASFADNVPSSSVAELKGAETSDNFMEKAFALKKGEISEPLVLGNNVLVLKLENITNEPSKTEDSTFVSYISNYDQDAASDVLFNSPKLKNNVASVFIKYFMNTNSQAKNSGSSKSKK